MHSINTARSAEIRGAGVSNTIQDSHTSLSLLNCYLNLPSWSVVCLTSIVVTRQPHRSSVELPTRTNIDWCHSQSRPCCRFGNLHRRQWIWINGPPPLPIHMTTCDRIFKSCVVTNISTSPLASPPIPTMILSSLLLLPSLALSLPTFSPRLLDSAFHLLHRQPLLASTNWSDIEPRTQSLQLLALGGATFLNSHFGLFSSSRTARR